MCDSGNAAYYIYDGALNFSIAQDSIYAQIDCCHIIQIVFVVQKELPQSCYNHDGATHIEIIDGV